MTTDDTRTDDGADTDALVGMEKRRRRAFTVSLVVVLAVVAIALTYSYFRDPGPQPTVPPKISGTEDGGLKRAIVHYLGAVESRDVDTMLGILDGTSARDKAMAAIVIDEFGEAAKQKAEATAGPDDSESGSVESVPVTIKYHDGRTQIVHFNRTNLRGEPWWAWPETDRPLPEPDPVPVEPGSPPSASASVD